MAKKKWEDIKLPPKQERLWGVFVILISVIFFAATYVPRYTVDKPFLEKNVDSLNLPLDFKLTSSYFDPHFLRFVGPNSTLTNKYKVNGTGDQIMRELWPLIQNAGYESFYGEIYKPGKCGYSFSRGQVDLFVTLSPCDLNSPDPNAQVDEVKIILSD